MCLLEAFLGYGLEQCPVFFPYLITQFVFVYVSMEMKGICSLIFYVHLLV